MKYRIIENLADCRYELQQNVGFIFARWMGVDWFRWYKPEEKEEALRTALAKMKHLSSPTVISEM
jgi:hypothetical protein